MVGSRERRTGTIQEGLVFGAEYLFEIRAVNGFGPGTAATVTFTAKPRGLVLTFAEGTTTCTGKADGAGFGTGVTLDDSGAIVFYAFYVFEKGADPTDGSQ